MKTLPVPRAFYSCRKSIDLEVLGDGWYSTTCRGAHECYGCNGRWKFKSSVHPDEVEEIARHTSQQVKGIHWGFGNVWMTEEEISKVLARYPDTYYYLRTLWCDLDTIFIYAVKEDANVDGTNGDNV